MNFLYKIHIFGSRYDIISAKVMSSAKKTDKKMRMPVRDAADSYPAFS